MRLMLIPLSLTLIIASIGCDRRDDPRNAPTPQPAGETRSPPTDPEQPTAPVEGEQPADKNTPADPKSGT